MSNELISNFVIRARDQFTGPMQRMNRQTTIFGRNARRNFGGVNQQLRSMRRLVGMGVAALTTGAIARGVQQFAAAGDEVAKMSRELGLGVEALQELRFAADRQGVSSEDLEKSLGALNNRVGQLRQGQGSLATALRDSNPELMAQLQGAEDTEAAFGLMMEALEGTENAADRAALAQAAFGRSGQALVRIAEAGTAGISDLREEARQYGNIISEDAARQSEHFTDAMTNMRATLEGVRNRALTPLISSLIPLVERMQQWVQQNQDLIQLKIEEYIQRIATTVQTLRRHWESGLIPAIIAGVAAFKVLTTVLAGVQSAMIALQAIKTAGGIVGLITGGPVVLIAAAIAAAIAGIYLLVKHWDKVKAAFTATMEFIRDLWDEIIGGIIRRIERVGELIRGLQGSTSGLNDGSSGGMYENFAQPIHEQRTQTNRSEVDVNIGNLPRGSSVNQSGDAPGVTVRTGYQSANLEPGLTF